MTESGWQGFIELDTQVTRCHVILSLFSRFQLLTEMDGFDSETGVMVIAATNRPEVLDPALTRPGRISRRVNVEAPDFAGRQQVLAVHMRSTPVEGDAVTLRAVVASLTPGFVGADLANVVNEAALLAARQGIVFAFALVLVVLKQGSLRIVTKCQKLGLVEFQTDFEFHFASRSISCYLRRLQRGS